MIVNQTHAKTVDCALISLITSDADVEADLLENDAKRVS